MIVFPAIDIKDGRVVRLLHGDYQKVTEYKVSPVEQALSYKQCGAEAVHVVDLDGAKDGTLSNYEIVQQIVASTDMFVEVGGGIRNSERIKKYLDAGVGRVILGSAAVNSPSFLTDAIRVFGADKVVVGVDMRDGRVATDGWQTLTSIDGVGFCEGLKEVGVSTVICTDIATDGALAGTNMQLYTRLCAIKGLDVVASGGVTFLDEFARLDEIGVAGVIVGKALYEGRLNLRDVLAAARGRIC